MPTHETPHIRSTVGANIARLRGAAKMSQRALAAEIGMDQISVSRWERGKVMPRPETLDQIARVFDIEVGLLYLHHDLKRAA